MVGVPAIVVAAGSYAGGLPFGLEFSARPRKDLDLLAIAHAGEQATPSRKPRRSSKKACSLSRRRASHDTRAESGDLKPESCW